VLLEAPIVRTLLILSVACAVLATTRHVDAQTTTQGEPTREQLQRWLRQYPEADADGDGVLTVEEAAAYRRELARRAREAEVAGIRSEFTFATMSDGVQIALAVAYPPECDPRELSQRWPAVLEMHGYPDSTVPQSTTAFGDRYVTVRASLRGAGASGGTIQAISERNGRDGHEIIEEWIVKQPWSNGRVALHGHSWGGLTALMIAATNPAHLSAVAVSGLFDDVYRDIGRIGGIRNAGFPVDWMVNLYRPTGPFGSGEAAREARGLSGAEYERIVGARPDWHLAEDLFWKALVSHEYDPAFARSSPGHFAAGVRAPIHIMHAYQDEQTGSSGVWLWRAIADDVPKRLVLCNGNHGDVGRFMRERRAWLDFWTLEAEESDPGDFTDSSRRVQVYFEIPRATNDTGVPYVSSDFPLPETVWTRYYCREGESLSTQPPPADTVEGDSYRVLFGTPDGQLDGARYLLAFDQPTALCGPIAVNLWVTCDTIDTDLYVVIADIGPDGAVQPLQRGLLRASHRAVDAEQSVAVELDGQSVRVRPRHTHRGLEPLVPGKPYLLEVEVFPVGHVFRPGHRLALWVSQPPQQDPVTRHSDGRPAYKYESAPPPGRVTILRGGQYASSLVLPLLPSLPPINETGPPPGAQSGIHVR
jgi:uncharacterized protein